MNNAKCTTCSKQFHTYPCRLTAGYKPYCSKVCSLASRVSRSTKSCKTCGVEFTRHASREKYGRGVFCSRACQYKANSESGSYLWKGGITPINKKIRCSPQYKQWRTRVFERDDYTCQACGSRGVELHADHELPFAFFPDLRFEVLNGRTLCVSCHRKTATWGAGVHIIYNFEMAYADS